ncbi:MAG: hypothetical protein FIA98_07095 [Anaerolineae bacterium]|nr:hypothetical protein [Anaerolineae bacterium]
MAGRGAWLAWLQPGNEITSGFFL